MKCIHVLRKPCSETTVVANVLTHGCGAINVDACRVGYESTPNPATIPLYRKEANYKNTNYSDAGSSSYSLKDGSGERNPNAGGRWPANLVLQHLEGCVQAGVKHVRSSDRPGHGHKQSPVHIVGPTHRHSEVRHGNLDGTETVAAYDCAPGCPVAALDAQSGVSTTPTKVTRGAGGQHGAYSPIPAQGVIPSYGDSGGASRFFKQFVGSVRSEDR